jgi:hypothetical protein
MPRNSLNLRRSTHLLPSDAATRVLLGAGLAALLLLVLLAVFAPPSQNDPTPATWNVGPHGAKAALLLLNSLGYQARTWEQPLSGLEHLPDTTVAHTTLILAAPQFTDADSDRLKAAIHQFLERGGSVLATGPSGAVLLGHDDLQPGTHLLGDLCLTTPEGQSPLARAGQVEIAAPAVWGGDPSTATLVSQRCGLDEAASAVVVQFRVGKGTATWWSAATPLSNAGLRKDPALRLLLASLAPEPSAEIAPGLAPKQAPRASAQSSSQATARTSSPRTNAPRVILFDESLHGAAVDDSTSPLAGLPLPLLLAQIALVALLLVFSYSRRHGPVRPLPALARTSPLEFAYSMGGLYSRAGATAVPVAAASRRLRRVLISLAGIPAHLLQADTTAPAVNPDAAPNPLVEALQTRHGAHALWARIAADLTEAAAAEANHRPVPAKQALAIVQALDRDSAAITHELRREQPIPAG